MKYISHSFSSIAAQTVGIPFLYSASDLALIEQRIGVFFPSDYYDFVTQVGVGCWTMAYMKIGVPFAPLEYHHMTFDAHYNRRDFPDTEPDPEFTIDSHGKYTLFGGSDDGETIGFETSELKTRRENLPIWDLAIGEKPIKRGNSIIELFQYYERRFTSANQGDDVKYYSPIKKQDDYTKWSASRP